MSAQPIPMLRPAQPPLCTVENEVRPIVDRLSIVEMVLADSSGGLTLDQARDLERIVSDALDDDKAVRTACVAQLQGDRS